MIPFPISDCWLVGDRLKSTRTGNSVSLKFSQDYGEGAFDGIDCGPADLCVTHLMFGGDARILEFINRCVAQRFDLPTRFVRVEYGDPLAGVAQSHVETANPTYQVLKSRIIHSVIPRDLWRRYKADHASQRAALEAELGAAP